MAFVPVPLPPLPLELYGVQLFCTYVVDSSGVGKPAASPPPQRPLPGFSFAKALTGAAHGGTSCTSRGDGRLPDGSLLLQSGNVVQLAPGALDPDNAETTLAQLDCLASLQRRPAAAATTEGSARASTAANPGLTHTRPAHRLLPLYREVHAAADSMIGGIDEDLDAWQPQGQLPRHMRGGAGGGTVGQGPAAGLQAPGTHPAAAPAPTQGSVVTAAGGSVGLSRHHAPSAHPPPSCAPTSNAGSNAIAEEGGGQLVAAGTGAEAGSRTGVEYELVEKAGDVLGPARFELQLHLPLLINLSAVEVEVGGRQVSVQVPGQQLIVVPLPRKVEDGGAKARWSKAKKRLTLTLPLA